MARADPWLSVVMPVRDGAGFLSATLERVAEGMVDGVEIVAVDDGSTDGTPAILDRFQSRLPLRIVRQSAGSWVAGTNLGLHESTAPFACILHQDDLWLPGRLSAIRPLLDPLRPDTMVLHHAIFIDRDGNCRGRWRCPLPSGFVPRDLALSRLLVQNFIAIPSPVFPRQRVLDTGGLDETLWYAADWDLWLRLVRDCTVRFVDKAYAAFRVHESAQTVTRSANTTEMAAQLASVRRRHAPALDAPPQIRAKVEAAGRFSDSLNVRLLGLAHGNRLDWPTLAKQFLSLGPSGWHRYARDSRIVERAWARSTLLRRLLRKS